MGGGDALVEVFLADRLQRFHAGQGEDHGAQAEVHPPEQLHRRHVGHRPAQQGQEAAEHRAVMFAQPGTQVVLRLAVGLPGEAEEDHRPAWFVAVGAQRQPRGHGEQLLQGHFATAAGFAFQFLELGVQGLAERRQIALEHRLDQRFLGTEVVIDRRQIDAGPAGDGAQAGLGEPLLGEQNFRRIKNALHGIGLGHAGLTPGNRRFKLAFEAPQVNCRSGPSPRKGAKRPAGYQRRH